MWAFKASKRDTFKVIPPEWTVTTMDELGSVDGMWM